MRKSTRREKVQNLIILIVMGLLCVCTIVFDYLEIPLTSDSFYNRTLTKTIQQICGICVALWLTRRLQIRLFDKVENWLYLLPCLLIAIDNFQWSAFFGGKMQLARKEFWDIALFFVYCMSVGLFEELIFRGVLFSLFACNLSQDRKGFLKTYVFSSVVFGLLHIFNGFSGATLAQVGYTCLTGGLFAFCFIKTKNILCCSFVHGLYNFCGLLFDSRGLGTGVVFDMGTVVTMLVISILVGVFVLYKVWNYTDEERTRLYARLGVPSKKEE